MSPIRKSRGGREIPALFEARQGATGTPTKKGKIVRVKSDLIFRTEIRTVKGEEAFTERAVKKNHLRREKEGLKKQASRGEKILYGSRKGRTVWQ